MSMPLTRATKSSADFSVLTFGALSAPDTGANKQKDIVKTINVKTDFFIEICINSIPSVIK
jgi:hypothetical protein